MDTDEIAKLIVTVRQSEEASDIVDYCLKNQINRFRINLGRSDNEKNKRLIERISKEIENPILFLDLPGSKKRLNRFEEKFRKVVIGDDIELFSQKENLKSPWSVPSSLIESSHVGDILVFGDNDVKAEIVEKKEDYLRVNVKKGERIKSHSGVINVTNYVPEEDISELEKTLIKEYDRCNVIWDVSFADTKRRILSCKEYVQKGKIVAKIETPQGVQNILELAEVSDGLMLARGDLSAFYGQEEINTEIFKRVVECSKKKKIISLAATNYFSNLKAEKNQGIDSDMILREVMQCVNCVVANETSSEKNWKEIFDDYFRLKKMIKGTE